MVDRFTPVQKEEHASPAPWTYCRQPDMWSGVGHRDWIEDANGSIVVENVGHIDGPLICAAVNDRHENRKEQPNA